MHNILHNTYVLSSFLKDGKLFMAFFSFTVTETLWIMSCLLSYKDRKFFMAVFSFTVTETLWMMSCLPSYKDRKFFMAVFSITVTAILRIMSCLPSYKDKRNLPITPFFIIFLAETESLCKPRSDLVGWCDRFPATAHGLRSGWSRPTPPVQGEPLDKLVEK